MFNIQGQQNPLELLLSHLGTGLVQQQAQNKENQQVNDLLGKFGPDSHPLEALNAIEGSRISPERKQQLHQVYQKAYDLKTRQSALGQKQQVAQGKAQKEAQEKEIGSQNLWNLALANGVDPSLIPEGTEFNQGEKIIKSLVGKKGPLTTQPVPPEVSQSVERVLAQNPEASADELLVAMDREGVPRQLSNAFVENRRRQQEKGNKREDIIEEQQAKEDIKYQSELPEKIKSLRERKQTTQRYEDLVKKGVTGKPYEKALEKIGLINLTSEGRREASSLSKEYARDFKAITGSQMSGQEFFTLLNAVPNPDFSKEANQAILNNYKIYDDIKQKEIDISNELIKKNKGKPPRNFGLEVQNQVSDYAQKHIPEVRKNIQVMKSALNKDVPSGKVLMYDPQGGILYADPTDVDEFLQLGAVFP